MSMYDTQAGEAPTGRAVKRKKKKVDLAPPAHQAMLKHQSWYNYLVQPEFVICFPLCLLVY